MKNFSEYFYENKLDKLLTLDKFFLKNKKTNKLVIKSKQLFVPDIEDLVILHKLIIKHKITSVMEFGAGYSTIIMAEAIFRNLIASDLS